MQNSASTLRTSADAALNALSDTFEKNQKYLGDKQLSRNIFNRTGKQQRIVVPLDDAKYIYEQIDNQITETSRMFSFIQKGMSHIIESEKNNSQHVGITANAAYQLDELITMYELHRPNWLPKTFMEENTSDIISHRYLYHFLWDTVRPELVGIYDRNVIEMEIERYATGQRNAENRDAAKGPLMSNAVLASLKNTLSTSANDASTAVTVESAPKDDPKPSLAAQNIATAQAAKKASAAVSVATGDEHATLSFAETALPERVKLSLLATRQYLSLYALSLQEQVPFSLSVEDLMEMLRTKNCHFTGLPLTREPESDGTIGGQHVAIARLTNGNGYVPGNIVVCSQQALDMKGNMDHDVFDKAMGALRILQQSGIQADHVSKMLNTQRVANA